MDTSAHPAPPWDTDNPGSLRAGAFSIDRPARTRIPHFYPRRTPARHAAPTNPLLRLVAAGYGVALVAVAVLAWWIA